MTRDELEAEFLRLLAKRDMAVWSRAYGKSAAGCVDDDEFDTETRRYIGQMKRVHPRLRRLLERESE
jgi:hypothetical protein